MEDEPRHYITKTIRWCNEDIDVTYAILNASMIRLSKVVIRGSELNLLPMLGGLLVPEVATDPVIDGAVLKVCPALHNIADLVEPDLWDRSPASYKLN